MEKTDKSSTPVSFNDLLSQTGGFGKWNWTLLTLCYISCVLAASNHLSIIYTAYSSAFRLDSGYSEDFNNQCGDTLEKVEMNTTSSTYVYDSSVFTSTVVTEWNLVCKDAALLPTLTFTYMLGIALTNLVAGAISDAYGRKVLVLSMAVIHIISSFVTWFSPNFWVFLIGRMFVGGSIHSAWAGLFILLQETTPRQHRTLTSGLMNFGWSTGSMWICFLAYFIRDWRNLQLVFSLMSLLMISFFFLLSESPRWLLASGRFDDAREALQVIATKNGRVLDLKEFENTMAYLQKEIFANTKTSFLGEMKKLFSIFLDLVKTPKMRQRTLLLMPTIFAVGMGTYGIHFSSRFADLDIFAVNMIKAVSQFSIVVAYMFILKYVDRSKCLWFLYVLNGIVAMSFYFTPSGARPIVFVIAQSLFSGNYYIIDTFIPELLPTPTRNFGFNFLEFVSKIGSSLAPFIVELGGAIDSGIPPLVFGCVLLVSSTSFLFLPETRGKPLPQSVKEVEDVPGVTIAGIVRSKLC
eukprot:GFUD01039196.1.p1 GENE.GFUD01039196.1~~GFUD01039196.1.p1  ORF type:complete len:521 (-),score=88.36 GFUD01039196.1:44-1606(-)